MFRASVFTGLLLGFFTLVISVAPAQAVPIEYSFTASDFPDTAPQDPVSGTIVYDADTLTSPINQLLSIDLTIAGYDYSLAEVGFIVVGPRLVAIGGLIAGVPSFGEFTDDFNFTFDLPTGSLINFSYVTSSTSFSKASTVSFTRTFVNEPVAVAEPSALALFAVGLLGLAVGGHRRRTFRWSR